MSPKRGYFLPCLEGKMPSGEDFGLCLYPDAVWELFGWNQSLHAPVNVELSLAEHRYIRTGCRRTAS